MKPRIIRANEGKTRTAPADRFVGEVLQDPIFDAEAPSRARVGRVTFTPGARTNWHTHSVGQILHVLSGVGRYQLDGERVQEIRPGDSVVIPPKTRHWHGAAPDQMMCHLAVSENADDGAGAEFFEPVSDEDYNADPA